MAFFPRTLGVFMDGSASSLYRIQRPMQALAACGYPVGYAYIHDVDDRMLQFYDMIVVSRTGSGDPERIRAALQSCKRSAKVLVMDYDDDVLNIPDHNPGKHESVDGILVALEESHGVVVTNNALAASFRPFVKQFAVIPNYMDFRSWPTGTPRISQKLTVGLTGTPSHVKDWEIVAEPMRRIRERHDIEFLVAGLLPNYLADLATTYIDWVPLHQYPYLINSIDIGLCPLVDDHFNRCKTPIKALELGLAGAAVVASPTQYLSVVKGKGTIARTADEWEQAIEKYIVDRQKREVAGRSLREYAETRWDVYRNIETIASGYKDLYRRCISPLGRYTQAA